MAGSWSVPDRIEGPLLVIGDVHGEIALLDRLLERLLGRSDCADRWVVFVGDLIDRGPNPRAVVERVLGLCRERGKVAACMGNHELALLGALQLFEHPPENNWDYRYAGHYHCRPTYTSYVQNGVPADTSWPERLAHGRRDLIAYRGLRRAAFDRLREEMPEDHRAFLQSLPWCVSHPDYLITHAGLLPDRPTAEQVECLRDRDFTDPHPPWLCDRDLLDTPLPRDCTQTVVTGHVTVSRNSVFHPFYRKICVDTGSGYPEFGALSAVLLPEREVVSVGYKEG